ncbi:Mtn3-like protein, partial [Globisporangium splendens]
MSDSALTTLLKVLTTLSSIAVCLSSAVDSRLIWKTKATVNISVLPLVSLWGNSYLWLIYGYLDGNILPLVITSIFGCITALIYIGVYFRWTDLRRYVVKLFCLVSLGLLFVSIYAVLGGFGVTHQARKQVTKVVGCIAVGINLLLYASPLETMLQVVRTKSAVTLPILICIGLATNDLLWVICGIVDNDMFVLTPNAIGVALGVVQIALYIIYNSNRRSAALVNGALPAPDSTRSKDGSRVSIVLSQKKSSCRSRTLESLTRVRPSSPFDRRSPHQLPSSRPQLSLAASQLSNVVAKSCVLDGCLAAPADLVALHRNSKLFGIELATGNPRLLGHYAEVPLLEERD